MEIQTKPRNRVGEKQSQSTCRFCATPLSQSVVDLGTSPLCQKHVKARQQHLMERFFPLKAMVCESCWLVQLDEFASPDDIFDGEYAYFSSYSSTWLKHCATYTQKMVKEYKLDKNNFVVEVASNDGYLLQYFHEKGIPVLGIEPTQNTAQAALQKGIPTEIQFFGVATAEDFVQKYGRADVLIGNNVLAHVPDLNDFVAGLQIFLADDGVLTMEFPHLQRLIEGNQFDTIYHEHFSYFSLTTVQKIFAYHGLRVFDVEELPTHGGSIRIYACHISDGTKITQQGLVDLLEREKNLGMQTLEYYSIFEEKVKTTKRALLQFLIQQKQAGKTIVGYGAPGKGNTLLNYCGIRTDFLDYTVDRNPHKQGNYLPGTRIPILHPNKIQTTKPDYVLILPWNLREEIMAQLAYIRDWGGQFIVPIPTVQVF